MPITAKILEPVTVISMSLPPTLLHLLYAFVHYSTERFQTGVVSR